MFVDIGVKGMWKNGSFGILSGVRGKITGGESSWFKLFLVSNPTITWWRFGQFSQNTSSYFYAGVKKNVFRVEPERSDLQLKDCFYPHRWRTDRGHSCHKEKMPFIKRIKIY